MVSSGFKVHFCEVLMRGYVVFVALRSNDEALDGHGVYTSPPGQLDSSKATRHFG